MSALAGVGRAAVGCIEFVGSASGLFVRAAGHLIRGHANARGTLAQMSSVGTDSLPIVAVTMVFAGMVLGLHTAREIVRFGGGSFVGGMVAVSVARELGPTLTGIVVAARVGSAMSAEIGSMKITEQIDALRALAVSPVQYLVVPRLLACAFMLPVLTVFADFAGAWGAYVVAVAAGVSPSEYTRSARQFLDFTDFFGGLSKTVVFGVIIAVVGCQQGFATRGGASGVGHATTRSVVISIMLIYIANFVLSALIFRVFG